MIPIQDEIRPRNFPLINWIIIVVNLIIFIYELRLPDNAIEGFFSTYGIVPANYTKDKLLANLMNGNLKYFFPFLSNMFLHGGFGHFIGNMWTLYIFGDNVEDVMGKFRYLLFYIICGILAGLSHLLLNGGSDIPAIGASGAISGVMAAYMFLYPRGRILFFIPVFIFIPIFVPLPAWLYLGVWFIGQLYGATASLMLSNAVTEIAFWAHIGGFVFGAALYRLFLDKKMVRKKKRIM